MKAGTTIPINQARPRLTEILEIVRREPVTITKDGTPVAVVVDPDGHIREVRLRITDDPSDCGRIYLRGFKALYAIGPATR